ncbi:MAG: PEP-CTERM sorting domain-containing protein [Opitutaceae bacterium]
MKNIASISVALLISTLSANAVLNFTDVTLNDTLLEFTVSGTLPGPAPSSTLTNINIFSSPNSTTWANSTSILSPTTNTVIADGTKSLGQVAIINTGTGDRIQMNFSGMELVIGDVITGTYSATIDPGVLTTANAGSLGFYWGGNSPANGEYLGAAVPEPSNYAAIGGLAAIGVALCRRRRA